MSSMDALRALLWREYRDQRQNKMLWPVYLIMPLVGAALPAMLAAMSAAILSPQLASANPEFGAMVGAVRALASVNGIELERAAAVLMLRISAGYFLLMPLAIVSIAGAYAIVGEKQQRTLEPVLATPISTRDFLLGKLLAVTVPATLVSWIAAVIGAGTSSASFYWSHRLLIWPDWFFWIAVFVLGPIIGAITALVCLRVSARMQDPQAANQVTALILIPVLLLLFSLLGPMLVLNLKALLASCVVGLVLTWGIFIWVRRGFNREEILCRWR